MINNILLDRCFGKNQKSSAKKTHPDSEECEVHQQHAAYKKNCRRLKIPDFCFRNNRTDLNGDRTLKFGTCNIRGLSDKITEITS